MSQIVFYFQVHQPYRLERHERGTIPSLTDYFDDRENERILRRVAERCYVPFNSLLLRKIEETAGAFRCAFSISGTALDQLEAWAPEALETFQDLASTGAVEFLCETSHHSLAALASSEEFRSQAITHATRIERLFGTYPTTFRNTELILSNDIAREIEDLGFDTILGEGAERLLGWRSPHFVYRPRGCERVALLLRDFQFSDDIAFRFSNRDWPHYPLMADTFASWLHRIPASDPYVGLFMDYETFGEHQGAEETGILDFMDHLPGYLLADEATRTNTPAGVVAGADRVLDLDLREPISWADAERDVSAWLGNPMQQAAHAALYETLESVRDEPELLDTWRRLSTSDHVYYMCTKRRSDGDVHEYFSPYYSPQDAFVLFMRALDNLHSCV